MSVQVKTTAGVVTVDGGKTWMSENGVLKVFGMVGERNECLMEFSPNYWLAVHQGNGTTGAAKTAASEQGKPTGGSDTPVHPATGWSEKGECPVCKRLGYKSSNPKFLVPALWSSKFDDGLVCNGVDPEGNRANHTLKAFAEGKYAEILT